MKSKTMTMLTCVNGRTYWLAQNDQGSDEQPLSRVWVNLARDEWPEKDRREAEARLSMAEHYRVLPASFIDCSELRLVDPAKADKDAWLLSDADVFLKLPFAGDEGRSVVYAAKAKAGEHDAHREEYSPSKPESGKPSYIFPAGTVVRMRSGGPEMTVEDSAGDRIACCWFDDGASLHRGLFSPAMLRPM